MATSYFTAESLIADVKRRAQIPSSQLTFQNADFLAFANEEMQIGLVPSILQVHEEFFATTDVVPVVANKSNYSIPARAIGNKLRDVFFQDENGNLAEMSRINSEDRTYYQNLVINTRFIYFFVQGNEIILTPPVGATPTGSLVFVYFQRPNQIVLENRVAYITDITVGASTTMFTVDGVPDGYTVDSVSDIIQTKPGHKTITIDINPTIVDSSSGTITFNNSDVPSTLSIEVGDQICFAGETNVPQIPDELGSVLSQRIAARCLEALNDVQGLQSANAKLSEMELKTGNLIDNRVEGSPQKINNLRGVLRMAKIRRKRFF